jgi:hypothetical protein
VELYLKKREYMIVHPAEIPPEEHSISKWVHFQPPIVSYEIAKSIHGTTGDFDNELLSLIRKGHADQTKHLDMYRSKTMQNTYGIVENINDIVKSKELLLKTQSRVPFLENACCNEKQTHPLTYFAEEDPNIDVLVKRSRKNALIVNDVDRLARPMILYNKEFTGIESLAVPSGVYDENIYGAFIHYCNFDNDIPIPDDLKALVKEKPDGFPRTASLEEKIEYLKRHGKRYTADDLRNLLAAVGQRNMIAPATDKPVDPVNQLRDLLEYLDMKQSTVVEEPLRKLLNDVLQQ